MKKIALLTLMLSIFSVFSIAAAEVYVSDQYIRETIPGTTISSAYMTLINKQDKDVYLVSIKSNISPRIELHEHTMSDGMMKMQQVESILIKANSEAVLKPHGYHIMIFNLDTPLKAETTQNMILVFSDGSQHSISIPVKGIKQLSHKH